MEALAQKNIAYCEEMSFPIEIINDGVKKPSPLLFILHELQDKVGYISEAAIYQISESLKIPTAELLSFITFHYQFKVKMANEPPPIEARNIIRLCSGAPCHTKGSSVLLDALGNLLNIQKGEVTADKNFALEVVDCLGTCGMSPVMMINDDIYGNLREEQLSGFLGKYK